MARQVKSTPVLSGEDARRFERETKENGRRQIPAEEYKRAEKAYNSIKFERRR